MAKRPAGGRTAKKKSVKVENEGLAYIQASFNNIIITITNKKGDVISWGTAGKEKFRGSKKSTPYAAQVASGNAAREDIGTIEAQEEIAAEMLDLLDAE